METKILDADAIRTMQDTAPTTGGVSKQKARISRLMVSPSVLLLLLWMAVPLSMTIYFSLIRYNLLYPGETSMSAWRTSGFS